MATRMQQRRGTAAQWISTNAGLGPVLNSGEIGWESDTNKFKIGDGVNNWANLDYFADINSTVNPAFGTSIVFEGATADSYETTLQVTDPTADRTITLPNATGTVITTGNLSDLTFVSNIVFEGATDNAFETTLAVTDPTADRTLTFPDSTGTVATQEYVDSAVSNAEVVQSELAGSGLTWNAGTEQFDVNTTTIQAKVADVSDTEIGYLNGVTSAIQTQIDNKASLSGATFTGAVSGTSLTLSGNLTVNGTTTNLNSTSLVIEDKNIVLGDTTTPTDTTADGGGITLKGATDKTINWVDATDAWTSSEDFNLVTGKAYEIAGTSVLSGSTLGSGVTGSSLTSVGTITSGTWNGTTIAVANGGTGITSFGTGIATFLGTPSSANLISAITDETGTGSLVFGTAPTLTNALNINTILRGPEERLTVSATAATGTIPLDVLTSGILYYTSNATANWTLNVRGSSGATLNDSLTTNDSITVVFFVTNGATPYYQTGFQIDGSAVTPKWQNGTAPAAGNANSIDIYSYTIVKTGNAAFTAFGSQTKFA
jgi:hypothetical protein